MDLFDNEPRDGFRRNLLVVLSVHIGLIATLWFINRGPRTVPEEQITWLDGSAFADSLIPSAPSAEAPAALRDEVLPPLAPVESELITEPEPAPSPSPPDPATPEPETATPRTEPPPTEPEPISPPPAPKPPEPEPQPEPIAEPKPTPRSTPAPMPKPVTKSAMKPKSTPRPEVKRETTAPKKAVKSTPSPKPATKTRAEVAAAGSASAKAANPGDGSRAGAPNGSASGSAAAAALQNYFGAVGEEFRACWKTYKPLFGESSGGNLTAMVHVRINSSGSVVEATLTTSTGNQEVDASIRKAFADFKRVPAPPAALLKAGIFESNMAVILSI